MSKPVRSDYYLPLDCPACGRHRLEPEIHQDDGGAFFVAKVTCEKCGSTWPEDEATPRQS